MVASTPGLWDERGRARTQAPTPPPAATEPLGRARHNGPETSRRAAKKNQRAKRSQRNLVLDALRDNPAGLTREQISERTGIRERAICGRVSELIEDGLVIKTHVRRTTASGSSAEVVRIVEVTA